MIDRGFLKALTELPAVGTACGPVVALLTDRFGAGFGRTLVEDGFCLFHRSDQPIEDLRIAFVAHLDEIGGCVYGRREAREGGGYSTRFWGNTADLFASAPLQSMDYLAESAAACSPARAEVIEADDEKRLVLYGENIRPFRTVWTFREETTFAGDTIEGKALDPRATVYAVTEAVRSINDSSVAALFVMAEECAMDVARKAVAFLTRGAPDLRLIVNADVPWISNLTDGKLDTPAVRIFEGRSFIDPAFGIRVADALTARSVEFHLSAARSGSQTALFTPLARTLSVALPSDGVHLPRVRMSLRGIERCVTLLTALADLRLPTAGEPFEHD